MESLVQVFGRPEATEGGGTKSMGHIYTWLPQSQQQLFTVSFALPTMMGVVI